MTNKTKVSKKKIKMISKETWTMVAIVNKINELIKALNIIKR